MSDPALMIELLELHAKEDAARIAELEAEVTRLRPGDAAERYWEARWRDEKAAVDRLKAALQALYDENADYIKINRLMRGDGTSAIHNQVMVQARAALSGEGVKPVDTGGNDDTADTFTRGF